MNSPLREQFALVIMRYKQLDLHIPSALGLQYSELAVMAKVSGGCICNNSGICVSDIQQNLHISKPAVSQILNGLEQKGYIIRTIDPKDRRKIAVTLTPVGDMVQADAKAYYEQTFDAVLEQFGIDNAETLLELLDRLTNILDQF